MTMGKEKMIKRIIVEAIRNTKKEIKEELYCKKLYKGLPIASRGTSMSTCISAIRHSTKLEVKTIFEIGANYGQDADWIARKLGLESKNVYLFEAHPLIADVCKQLYDYNVYNVAVYNERGEMAFNLCDLGQNSGVSSIRKLEGWNYVDTTTVQTIRMDEFMAENSIEKIDFLKLDVEGVNWEVLDGFGDRLKDVGAIHVESEHVDICGSRLWPEIEEILKANPDKKILSISQNDNPYNCQCENCLKSDAEEGSPVGTLIKFVNRVAEILEPEFPDVMFDILAYHYTRPASRKTQTRHNVCVRLCASSTCFAHPYDKCDDRSRAVKHPNGKTTVFIDDLIEWSKVCNRLYVWDYTSNFPLYPMPFANWRVLQPNLHTMAKHNVKGVFEEANCAANGGVDFNELRTYLLCKLMWNPDCDIDAYRKEFMEYYYGEAAPHLDKYLNMLCDFVEKENYHLYIQDTKRPDYLSEELLITYNDLFDKAEMAVAGDGIRLSRVQKARLSIRFVDIFWNEILSGNYNAQKINQFFTDLRAHNISRLDEWSNIERTYRAWMEGKERGVYLSTPWRYDRESIL